MKYRGSSRRIEVLPYTSFRGAWVTFCPKCNYLLKFTAAVGRRDFSDNIGNTNYNFLEYEKPYMDYSDYFGEKVCEIKNQIILKLQEIRIDDWGIPYKDWKESETSDSFKFLIKFYTNLENYCDSIVGDKEKPMKEKISALPVESGIKDLLENLRVLRNKVAHANYELNQEDEVFTIIIIKST